MDVCYLKNLYVSLVLIDYLQGVGLRIGPGTRPSCILAAYGQVVEVQGYAVGNLNRNFINHEVCLIKYQGPPLAGASLHQDHWKIIGGGDSVHRVLVVPVGSPIVVVPVVGMIGVLVPGDGRADRDLPVFQLGLRRSRYTLSNVKLQGNLVSPGNYGRISEGGIDDLIYPLGLTRQRTIGV